MDTIFALASGPTRASIAVIRVSGARALETFRALCWKGDIEPRQVQYHTITDPGTGKTLDQGIILYFQAPQSYTGEDVVEFQLHGGRAVVDGVLEALSKIEGCRQAEPGEFSKRSFVNGKMDLTEAEAVADLINAETEAQRLLALDQMGGALSQLYESWAENLTLLLAHQEAEIEFPDEDLPEGLADTLQPQLQKLLKEIRDHLNDGRRGERLREGVSVAILGAPNAGKSSLLNALARRDAAIVSDTAGTTRDVIEVHLDLNGYPVILADTAGLRATGDKIEAEGVRRAEDRAQKADLKLLLFDATLAQRDAETSKHLDDKALVVATKADLPAAKSAAGELRVSAQTGEGMEALLKLLSEKVAASFKSRPGPVLTRQRHRDALEETAAALGRSLAAELPELAAEDLRLGLRALGRITGRVHVEELLDRIFRDFCIGK
jgi:tRNA modification GTPase